LCAKFMSERYSDIPMAVAGRNAEKLESIKKKHNLPFPTIVADAFDVEALNSMCKETEVVLSTVGPYHKYGSELLEACIKNGCHYVDITGESFWIKDMIDKHHQTATDKGIRIINAYTSKEYTYVPWKTICLIVAGLIYFIYPVDLIPDFIPVSGLIDDIALIAWIYESIQDDIENFLEWEKTSKS